MLHAVEMGWYILNKYYAKADDAPVYVTALMLNPELRFKYIEQNWKPEWLDTAKSSAVSLWDKHCAGIKSPAEPQATPSSLNQLKQPNVLEELKAQFKPTIKASITDDMLAFITAPATALPAGMTPLQWWCLAQQRQAYPRLSQLAIVILSIPAESAEPERAFSLARRTCRWDRLRLHCTTIEMIECISNWLREKIILPAWDGGVGFSHLRSDADVDMSLFNGNTPDEVVEALEQAVEEAGLFDF
jgi:hypothetical protein